MQLKRRIFVLFAVLVVPLLLPGTSAAQSPGTPGNPAPPADAPAAQTGSPATAEPATETITGKKKAEEEIVVTGSRIRRKDLTTPAPVTVISKEQVVASGKVSIGDFLQTLPEQGNAINTAVNNGGDGSTRVSLRGLGTQRTLVLLNGRRMVAGGDGADSSVDLNTIPTAVIERIEVLKDGASTVYGSDAVAGVINVITRKTLNGSEATGFAGTSTHSDGSIYDLSFTTGTVGDRGNGLLSIGYYDQHAIFAGARDYSSHQVSFDYACGVAAKDDTAFQKCITNSGSSAVPQGRFTIPRDGNGNILAGNAFYSSLQAAFPGKSVFIYDPKASTAVGGWRPYVGATDAYNFQPANYNQTPSTRLSLFATGDVKFGEAARGYLEASYVNRQSDRSLAPMPLFTVGAVTVSAQNAYNPFGVDISDVRRRLVEFGNRRYFDDVSTFRVVGGMDGTMPDSLGPLKGWYWDANVNYGRNQAALTIYGPLEIHKIAAAVGPSWKDSAGQWHCGTDAANDIPGCVPLDLFHGPGSITQDQIQGIGFVGTSRGINQQTSAQFTTSGELFTLAADRPVGLALGYEFRRLYGAFTPDPIQVDFDSTDNNALATQGGYSVNEGYGELSIPIMNHAPLVENLEATASVRVFNYSTFGTDSTYKFGARYSPIRDFTIRGTYSTAFRAPSISDLYLGTSDNFPSASDPCRDLAGAPASLKTNCTSPAGGGQGTPAGGSNDDQIQLKTRNGGNPDLKPETAKVFTIGAVIEPSMVKNLSITVDYYNFDITQSISTYGIAVILQGCYSATGAGDSKYCKLIHRDSLGRILSIDDLNVNVGSDVTDGVDIAMRYAYPTDFGRLGLLFDAVWLHKFDRTLADKTVQHGRGTYDINNGGIGGVRPAWKFNVGLRYNLGGFGAGINGKYIGSYYECANGDGINGSDGSCRDNADLVHKVSGYSTWDIFLNYGLKTDFGRTTLAVGMLNALNTAPPLVFNAFTPTSDPTAYDFVGRYMYGRISHAF